MYAIQAKKRKNSRKFEKIIFESENEQDIISYMQDNNLHVINKPYIFTHLGLNDDMILTCSISGIICSPEKIAELLT